MLFSFLVPVVFYHCLFVRTSDLGLCVCRIRRGSGLDGFYSILAGVGFTVLPGWGRLLLSFCRVRGSGVRRRSSGVSGNGAFGCLMVIQDVSRFSFR